jgi:hypothetical protein
MLNVNGIARFRIIGSEAYVGAVMNLRGITFTWKSEPQMANTIAL